MKDLLTAVLCCIVMSSCGERRSVDEPLIDPSASYRVRFSEDRTLAHVEAEFSIDEPVIFMYVQGTEQLPNGEASFIRNLTMTDTAGRNIDLRDKGMGDWEHDAERGQRVTLRYDIALEHHRYPWPSGIDEVLFVRDDALFFTGDALFIVPGEHLKEISVTFDVPKEWNISVPWKRTGENSFRAENNRDLLVNCGMAGTHDVRTVRVDSFTLQLAIGGSQRSAADLFVTTMTPALRAYSSLFGGSRLKDYLIVIHDDVRSDGGAFRSSFSQVIDGPANKNSVVTWGHTMLHELFHLWNGIAITPSSQEEWFKEGATDYMTVKYLRSLGIFTEEQFLKAMENTYRKYVLAGLIGSMSGQPPVSIGAAGDEKAKHRLLVYGGGSLAAMMLDIELRTRSGGNHGIEDLLKRLYEEFALKDLRYSRSDLIRVSGELAGEPMEQFFAAVVDGTAPLDVRPYYTRLGLQLDTFVEEVYLSRLPDAGKEQQLLYRSVFGK